MAYFLNNVAKIVGIATAVPKNKSYVDDYTTKFGDDVVRKFKKSTGINSMHRTTVHQTAGDLGFEASEYLLERFNVDKNKIGILIFITQSPDYRRPATACVLQKRLNLPITCAAFDVNLGCSAFIYGVQIMNSMLSSSHNVDYGLLVIGETSSKLADENDQSVAMMFGDAASAILFSNEYTNATCSTQLNTDGSRFKTIIAPAGGFRDRMPVEEMYLGSDSKIHSKYSLYMDGLSVFTFAINEVANSINEYFCRWSKSESDYDYIIFHQANLLILKYLMKKIGLEKWKVPISLDRYGNTSGVSIPLTICDFFGSTEAQPKEVKLLLIGFGTGLSWGITELTLDIGNVLPIIETDKYYVDGLINNL